MSVVKDAINKKRTQICTRFQAEHEELIVQNHIVFAYDNDDFVGFGRPFAAYDFVLRVDKRGVFGYFRPRLAYRIGKIRHCLSDRHFLLPHYVKRHFLNFHIFQTGNCLCRFNKLIEKRKHIFGIRHCLHIISIALGVGDVNVERSAVVIFDGCEFLVKVGVDFLLQAVQIVRFAFYKARNEVAKHEFTLKFIVVDFTAARTRTAESHKVLHERHHVHTGLTNADRIS